MGVIINPYNFIRWDDLGNGTEDTSSDVARPYIQDGNRCPMMPIVKHGEAIRWYINSINGTDFITDQANCKLDLINYNTGATTLADCAPLQIDSFTNPLGDPSFNFYAEVVLTALNVPQGRYYFRIRSNDGLTNWLQSNPIMVVSTTNLTILNATTLAVFRHDRYFYGFRYQVLTTFFNQFRIMINLANVQPQGTFDTYKEVTTGERRIYNTSLDEVDTIETYYFDLEASRFAGIMFAHSDLSLNGKNYKIKEAFQIAFDQRTKQYKGTCELWNQDFASLNRCNP